MAAEHTQRNVRLLLFDTFALVPRAFNVRFFTTFCCNKNVKFSATEYAISRSKNNPQFSATGAMLPPRPFPSRDTSQDGTHSAPVVPRFSSLGPAVNVATTLIQLPTPLDYEQLKWWLALLHTLRSRKHSTYYRFHNKHHGTFGHTP